MASWCPSEGVGADRRDRRRRTAATGRARVGRPVTDETESRDSVVAKPDVHRRFTLSSIDGFGSDLILWIEVHEFYKFALSIEV